MEHFKIGQKLKRTGQGNYSDGEWETEKSKIFTIVQHSFREIENGFRTKEDQTDYNYPYGSDNFELVEDVEEKADDKRGDGQATDYYQLPENATQLGDLIRHKHMEHGIGEAFCALYRLNDNGEKLRNLKKALYYITEEISWMEEQE